MNNSSICFTFSAFVIACASFRPLKLRTSLRDFNHNFGDFVTQERNLEVAYDFKRKLLKDGTTSPLKDIGEYNQLIKQKTKITKEVLDKKHELIIPRFYSEVGGKNILTNPMS